MVPELRFNHDNLTGCCIPYKWEGKGKPQAPQPP